MIGTALSIGGRILRYSLMTTLFFAVFGFLGNTLASGYQSVHAGGEQPVFDFKEFADKWTERLDNAEASIQNFASHFGVTTHAAEGARVVHVADGDTITVDVNGDRKVIRIIGADTPETKKPGEPIQCYGRAASDHTKKTLDGERVTLSYDKERTDRYGRTLAYVAHHGRDYSANLIRGGYARTLTIPPNTAHAHIYEKLQRKAKKAKRGLWGACK